MPIVKEDSVPFRFGCSPRFPEDIARFSRPVPGPIYNIPSTISSGIKDTSKLDDQQNSKTKKKEVAEKPNVPFLDRTSWLTGGRSQRHQNPGPKYNPKYDIVTKQDPKIGIKSGPRFESKKRFVSKELVKENLLRESPGAKYDQVDIDVIKKTAPSHTFGARIHRPRENQHYAYLEECMGEIMPGVGPAEYDTTHHNQIGQKNGSANVIIGESKRFQDAVKGRFISYKHSKHSRLGLYSPGPMYNPQQHSIAARAAKTSRFRIPGDGPFPVPQGEFVRTTASKPRSDDRSTFLRSKNVKSGGLEKTEKYFDDSPGPGAYSLPSTFHQWGDSPGVYDVLAARKKALGSSSARNSKRNNTHRSGAQTARAMSELKFDFTRREERLDRTKRVLYEQIKKTDKLTGESMLQNTTRLTRFSRPSNAQAPATPRPAPRKTTKSANNSKTQTLKKKDIVPINNPFKSRNQFVRDDSKFEYRQIGDIR